MSSLVVTNAVLLTMDPDQPDPVTGWLLVGNDGRIEALGAGEAPPQPPGVTVLDVAGAFVAPGFVSAHSHLFTSGSRGLATDESLYAWIEAMTAPLHGASDEDIYWVTRHGAQDFLSNGITTAYDFTSGGLVFQRESSGKASYQDAVPSPTFQHAQLRAKVDAGLRHVHAVMLAQTTDRHAVMDHVDAVVSLAKAVTDPTHLAMSVMGTVQWADSAETAALEGEVMSRHAITNQPHLLETPHEIEFQRSKFWWYRDAGVLGRDLIFGHFIQTTEQILQAAADAGCAMSWQPMSNGRLASGIADIPRIRELGMRVGIGLDDQSCTDVSDPFANMRTGIYLLRASRHDPAAMPVRDMLELHTRGSAQALGIDDSVGSLRVGRFADFLVVDPRRPDTGPVWDPWGTYVLACGLRNLKAVYVGGRCVSDIDGLTDPDAREVEAQVHQRLRRLAAR